MKTNPTLRRSRLHGSAKRSAGFTLIELMVSVTIGLAMLAGLAGVLASSSSSSRTNDRTSEIESNGRYALNSIKRELRQSGYRGYTWADPNETPAPAVGTITGECGGGTGQFVTNIRQGIWGANDSNPFSANCIPDKVGGAGGDVLVIRRMDGIAVADASLVANTLYFRSTYNTGKIFRGTTIPDVGTDDPKGSFALQSYVYYVRPYTVSATEVPLVPALFRVAIQPDGSMSRELVTSNIEQLQLQYGRLTTAPNTQFFDEFTAANCAFCSLDAGTATTRTATVWDEVDSVRIWVLARSAAPEPGYANTTSYVMGDTTYTVNDSFRRQLFSTVVQLRN